MRTQIITIVSAWCTPILIVWWVTRRSHFHTLSLSLSLSIYIYTGERLSTPPYNTHVDAGGVGGFGVWTTGFRSVAVVSVCIHPPFNSDYHILVLSLKQGYLHTNSKPVSFGKKRKIGKTENVKISRKRLLL